jgi:small subunit ribosomal protein S3
MGQKVNPNGFRIGFNKGWVSHWFATKGYAAALQEDSAIRTHIEKRYHHSGIAKVDIFRNREDLTVNLYTSKPGIVIGRGGAGSQELRQKLELAVRKVRKDATGKVNLRVNIIEARSPELTAKLVAETIANQLERRISVKRAMKSAVERTMEKRAKGIKIKVSGRLNGADIARSEVVSQGSIPLQTLRSDINYALAEAVTTFGVIGVKVWIYLGDSEHLPLEATPEVHRGSNNRQGGRPQGGDRDRRSSGRPAPKR